MKQQLVNSLPSPWRAITTSLLFITFTLISFMICKAVFAESLTLAWDANTENDLAGYKVYYTTVPEDGPFSGNGLDQGPSPITISVSALASTNAPSTEISGLSPGQKYFFTITAYNTMDVESDFSNMVDYVVPVPPQVFHTIAASASGQGSLSPSGAIEVMAGDRQSFTILPEAHYHIEDVLVDGQSVGPVSAYAFNQVNAPHTIEAVFTVDTHTITAINGSNGNIDMPGKVEVAYGSSYTCAISPDAGYHIEEVLVDGNAVGQVSSYTFDNINADHIIETQFAINRYTITATLTGKGAISPEGSVELAHGTNQSYEIFQNNGYRIADVKVDGISVGVVENYVFANVNQDHAIEASFELVPQPFQMEAGEVALNHNWKQVAFAKTFVNPVVVASALSLNGSHPSTLRIDNVTSTGFDISVQEWDYLDGWHTNETVGYIVMEAGTHTLPNGSQVAAGTFTTDKTGAFEKITFAQPFNQNPVILSSVNSFNEPDTVAGRMRNISTTSFEYQMQEEEAGSDGHGTETIAYIAWEPSMGNIEGMLYEVGKTADAVTHSESSISFAQSFETAPVFVAAMQTRDGSDPSSIRWSNLTPQGVKVNIEEEQSKDDEQTHTTEIAGYMMFAAEPVALDSDGDGILDDQERLTYQTDPDQADTDGDGLLDGEELDYWLDNWDGDIDQDGIVNLLDNDSDQDGLLDGEELKMGYDPADFLSKPFDNMIEYGQVTLDHNWKQVAFAKTFVNPVVVASALSLNGSHPSTLRIDNVTSTGFDISVQEWDYLDGWHTNETVGYIVMEAGTHTLPNGSQVAAGTFTTDKTGAFEKITFAQPFNQTPVLVSSVNSFNEPDTVAGRMRNISTTSFEYQMQEEEASSDGHGTETIAYIAWEPSMGNIEGMLYEVGKTADAVTHSASDISFAQSFETAPVFVAAMQTRDGSDPASIRWSGLTPQGVKVNIEEEQSKDDEQTHTTEIVGYMMFAEK